VSLVGLIASGILGLAFSPGDSAVPAGATTPVSLEEALRLGDLHSPLVRRAQAETTDGWRAGKFDLFRVIQASRDVGEARRAQLAAIEDFWQAVVELDRATGAI
jgi:outer membrane protein TolC